MPPKAAMSEARLNFRRSLSEAGAKGVLNAIANAKADFLNGLTIVEAIADLQELGKTESGKNFDRERVGFTFGAYLASRVDGVSSTSALLFATSVWNSTAKDFGLMQAEIEKLSTCDEVEARQKELTAAAEAKKPIKVVLSASGTFSSEVGTAVAKAKRAGISEGQAASEALAIVKAAYADAK